MGLRREDTHTSTPSFQLKAAAHILSLKGKTVLELRSRAKEPS